MNWVCDSSDFFLFYQNVCWSKTVGHSIYDSSNFRASVHIIHLWAMCIYQQQHLRWLIRGFELICATIFFCSFAHFVQCYPLLLLLFAVTRVHISYSHTCMYECKMCDYLWIVFHMYTWNLTKYGVNQFSFRVSV